MVLAFLVAMVSPACQRPEGQFPSEARRSSKPVDLLSDEWQGHAIAYSGYRHGQSPESGVCPSQAQVAEDLRILERNWRHRKAEIDIIALKGETLAVVEVKTRNTDKFGKPQDFVNQKKIGLMVRAVNAYVILRNLDVEVRFDIIGIVGRGQSSRLEHLEDAFFYFDV